VPSVHFPGKNHKWVLARWMQKGWMLSNETFYSVIIRLKCLILVLIFYIFSSQKEYSKGIAFNNYYCKE
jgi:hypothetical protein